jgi:hypothetical protein
MEAQHVLSSQGIAAAGLMPFRVRALGDRLLVTGALGQAVVLTPEEMRLFLEGTAAEPVLQARLAAAHLLADQVEHSVLGALWRDRHRGLFRGPVRHQLVLTAPPASGGAKMSLLVADRALDIAFSSTSHELAFDLTGADPLDNWEVLQHAIEYARQKGVLAGKTIAFRLLSGLAGLDDLRAKYLVERRVRLGLRVDMIGPKWTEEGALLAGARLFAQAEAAAEIEPDRTAMEMVIVVHRPEPALAEHLVSVAADLGCRFICVEADLAAAGDAAGLLTVHRRVLDLALQRTLAGRFLVEDRAATLLARILGNGSPDPFAGGWPGSPALEELVYAPDGGVFASTEGYELALAGDATLRLGQVHDGLRTLAAGAPSRVLALARVGDGLPGCASCVYMPWCGQRPELNYATQGSIFGRMGDSVWCRRQMGLFDTLWGLLDTEPGSAGRQALENWASSEREARLVHGPDLK